MIALKEKSVKAYKEVMCVKQHACAHKKEGESDTLSCSTDTSPWSTPSRLCCGSNTPHYSWEFEDQTPEAKSLDKWQELKPLGSRKGILLTQLGCKSNIATNYTAHQLMKFPPIKSLQVSKSRVQSANMNCIKELKSQLWDLQHQLSEARTENKLLKRLQHRHTVALQHFQDSEGSISQILTKHNNEVRVLQVLLRETRTCRDNLARQLQATENKLLNAKASVQHLQLLSQDHSLLEREELSLRLTKATADLEEKDKRILDLERCLELCQGSFNRQLATEHRKINEARKISCYLQEQIYQLTKEIQDREKELETHNIYSHRFIKGSNHKGRENKMVQTDGLVLIPTEAASLSDSQYSETEERLEEQESSMNWTLLSRMIFQKKTEGNCTEEKEVIDAPQELDEEHTDEHESQVSDILEESLNTTEPKGKKYKLPKTKRNYTFKQTVENLHSGRPAYSSVDMSPGESTHSQTRIESRDPQPSTVGFVNLLAGKSRRDGVGSPQCD
ncbi:hypothetical protein PAMP_018815 [Pampus punctatissimus]